MAESTVRDGDKGIDLLRNNKNFEYEIIENTSKENLTKVLPKFDGIPAVLEMLATDLLG